MSKIKIIQTLFLLISIIISCSMAQAQINDEKLIINDEPTPDTQKIEKLIYKDRSIFYVTGQSFDWTETVNGVEFVNETGELWGLGLIWDAPIFHCWFLRLMTEFTFGTIDYDGGLQTSDGEYIPYQSETSYMMLKAEANLGLKISIGGQNWLCPYGGLGTRIWERDLTADEYGYIEDWLTFYGIIGIRWETAIGKKTELYAQAQVNNALWNKEEIDFSNLGYCGTIELEPGTEASLAGEIGINIRPLNIAVYVETLKFSQSPLDEDFRAFFQPESEATIIGARIGYNF